MSPSFPHAFSGNPGGIRTGPPIKTFGGDVLRIAIHLLPANFKAEPQAQNRVTLLITNPNGDRIRRYVSTDSFWWAGASFQQDAAREILRCALRMTLHRSCHPESFGFAQDKLREGSGVKLSHYCPVSLTPKLLQGYGRIFDAELRRQTCWKKLIR
jgi:hypothetical protein